MKTLLRFSLVLLAVVVLASTANAANRFAVSAGGNWNSTSTWSTTEGGPGGASVPTSTDAVTISLGATVTVDVSNATCLSLQLGSLTSGNGAGTIVFSSGSQLTVSGAVTFGASGSSSRFGTVTMTSGGTLTAQSLIIGSSSSVWTPGTGTVELTATNTLPSSIITSFNNLTITAGTTTLGANTAVNGTLTVTAGTFMVGAFTYSVTGATVVSGTLSITSATGTKTFTGNVTINNGGTWNETASEAISFGGNLQNDGTLTDGGGAHTFTGATRTFSGANAISIANVAVTGTYTNNGTLTVGTALSGAGSLTQGTNDTLNLGGTSSITTLAATASGNTVNYNGAAQSIFTGITYYHLVLSGSGTKTQTGAVSITTNGDLTFSGTATMTTTAPVTVNGGLTVNSGATFNIGGFTASIAGPTSVTGTLTFSHTAGTKTLGSITVNNGGVISFTAAEAVTVNGNLQVDGSGTITGTQGTWTFQKSGGGGTISGTAASTTLTAATFTTAYTNSGNYTVSGTLTVTGTTLTNDGTLSAASALSGSGTLTQATSAILNIGGTSGITTLTATANPNTVNYNGGAAQTIKATTYHHLTLSNASTKTAGGALTVNGDLTLSGSARFAGGTSLTHTFLGIWIVNTSDATPFSFTTSSTINFNTPSPAAATSISGTSTATLGFNSVNLNNTSGFSSSLNFNITGTLTVAANVTFTPSAGVVINGAAAQGTIAGSGTVKVTRTAATADYSSQYKFTTNTLSSLTVEYAGSAAQTITALSYGSLKMNNSSGATLAGDATVNGTLTFTDGNIATSSNTLYISSTGSVSRTNGHVVGNFKKNVATGATSKTFEVGDASSYTPALVSFASVTTAGDLTASVVSGDHANIGTSIINAAQSVNRNWTFTNNGIVFTNYDATFTFVAGDADGGASTSAFSVGEYSGGSWTYPTVGTKTTTSTQATGLSAFGDFQVGTITYTISGRMLNTSSIAISGVTVVLSGGQAGSTSTDVNGDYSFADIPSANNYTITPTKTNYTFSPASLTYNNLSADQTTADFTGTSTITYTISGHIQNSSAVAISGVTVNLSGGQTSSTSTDVNGDYAFAGLPSTNTYTVTPSLTNYTFSATSLTYNDLSASQSGNFTGAMTPNVTLTASVSPTGAVQPRTDLVYTISFSNVGAGPASALVITDPIPANTDFKLGSMTTSLGTTGLTPTLAYSDNGGVTWIYTPSSAAGGAPVGYDRDVTHVRWSFGSSLSPTSPNNAGSVAFTARIQ